MSDLWSVPRASLDQKTLLQSREDQTIGQKATKTTENCIECRGGRRLAADANTPRQQTSRLRKASDDHNGPSDSTRRWLRSSTATIEGSSSPPPTTQRLLVGCR